MTEHYAIENPNSSGQGFCAAHPENPHHAVLTAHGWTYSHTTRITAVDGSHFGHHSYRFPGTDWVVGVDARPGWKAVAHNLGSGRRSIYFGSQLGRYLERKTAKLRKGLEVSRKAT